MFGLEEHERKDPKINEKIRNVAKMANCLEMIENLPEKFETNCGQRGITSNLYFTQPDSKLLLT